METASPRPKQYLGHTYRTAHTASKPYVLLVVVWLRIYGQLKATVTDSYQITPTIMGCEPSCYNICMYVHYQANNGITSDKIRRHHTRKTKPETLEERLLWRKPEVVPR